MPENIKDEIDILVKLQKLETEKAENKAIIDSLPEKLASFDTSILRLENVIKDKEVLLKDIQTKYRDYEADIQTNRSMIGKSKEKQMSAKTNKEYQASLTEIEKLEKMNSDIEDEMLECLDKADLTEKEVKSKKEEYEQVKKEIDKEKEGIAREAEIKENRIRELEADWKTISNQGDPALLNKFRKIREKLGIGPAIVPVHNAVCFGCHVNIPPQMFNELQRFDSLKMCPNCQRIIYWENL